MEIAEHVLGDTFIVDLLFQDVNGSAIDISGKLLLATFKTSIDADADDSSAILKKNWTIPSNADSHNGIFIDQIDPADILTLPVGDYYFNVRLVGSTTEIGSSETIIVRIVNTPTRRTTGA